MKSTLSRPAWASSKHNGKHDDDLLFSTSTGAPISRNTFRTRVRLPAIERSGLRQHVRFHDLRSAHAAWLLAGGTDLKIVTDRLGHRQITTTQQYLGSLPDAGERALAALTQSGDAVISWTIPLP